MSNHRRSMKKTIRILAVTLALSLFSAPVLADMLPIVVDLTQGDEPAYWWSTAHPQARGPVDNALFDERVQGVVSPIEAQNFSVSRVFQRPKLSVVNAQQMARMTGATSFFLGEAHASTTEVRWLDSTAAIVTIRGELYDTRSGSLLGNVEILGRGVSSTASAAITVAARSAAQDLSHFQPGRGRAKQNQDLSNVEVVIHSHDGAQSFVTLQRHFSERVADNATVHTCRASEGEVALCIYSEQQSNDALRRILLQDLERTVGDVVIDELVENGNIIHINAHTPSEHDSKSEDGRPLL